MIVVEPAARRTRQRRRGARRARDPAPGRDVPARRQRRPGAEPPHRRRPARRSPRSARRAATAGWRRCGPAAPTAPSLHLRHRSGEYNAPFARGVLAGRDPVLVHLWRREQGLLVPPGNPRGVESHPRSCRAARRPPAAPGRGPARCSTASCSTPGSSRRRSPARRSSCTSTSRSPSPPARPTPGSDCAAPRRRSASTSSRSRGSRSRSRPRAPQSGGLAPLLDALAAPATAERIVALGGYDIAGAGEVIDVA